MITKELVYLYALLYRAPVEQTKFISDVFVSDQDARKWVERLLSLSEKLALANDSPIKLSDAGYLNSVFEGLLRDGHPLEYGFSTQELSLSSHFFPTKQPIGVHHKQWKKLSGEIDSLPQEDIRSYTETLLNLLHKYTVTIPCSVEGAKTISYYDYAKTLSGIATSLFCWWKASSKSGDFELTKDDEPLILVGGDLSGIQEYIFDVVSKSAAKSLKGRSFYLDLLMDSILQMLKIKCKLFDGNIIYASGGSFLVVAPNTPEVTNQFNRFEGGHFLYDVQSGLKEYHGSALYLALDYVVPDYNKLIEDGLDKVLRELHIDKLSKSKNRRYHQFLSREEEYDNWFSPQPADLIRDKFSGEAISREDLPRTYFFKDDDIMPKKSSAQQQSKGEDLLLESTASQILLGRALRDAKYWVTATEELSFIPSRFAFDPCQFGVKHYLVSEEYLSAKKLSGYAARVLTINNPSFHSDLGSSHQYGFCFYGGNDYPKDAKGFPKSFNELAGGKEEGKDSALDYKEIGLKRLGVLRMDVDNLGFIIQGGNSQVKLSLAAYSVMSRSLDYFFKGYLNTIWASEKAYKQYTQIIYSGGDDLFLVGRWDCALELAESINQELKKWVCDNPYISLSAGLAVVTQKFPIIKAADMAGDSEGRAKRYRRDLAAESSHLLAEKNAMTLFDVPLHWQEVSFEIEGKKHLWLNEFEVVAQLKKDLVRLLEEDAQFSNALLRKIQTLYEVKKRIEEEGAADKYRWRWMLAYDLTKTREKIRRVGTKASWEFVNRILNDYILGLTSNTHKNHNEDRHFKLSNQSNYEFIDLLSVAARWAELEQRTKPIFGPVMG